MSKKTGTASSDVANITSSSSSSAPGTVEGKKRRLDNPAVNDITKRRESFQKYLQDCSRTEKVITATVLSATFLPRGTPEEELINGCTDGMSFMLAVVFHFEFDNQISNVLRGTEPITNPKTKDVLFHVLNNTITTSKYPVHCAYYLNYDQLKDLVRGFPSFSPPNGQGAWVQLAFRCALKGKTYTQETSHLFLRDYITEFKFHCETSLKPANVFEGYYTVKLEYVWEYFDDEEPKSLETLAEYLNEWDLKKRATPKEQRSADNSPMKR